MKKGPKISKSWLIVLLAFLIPLKFCASPKMDGFPRTVKYDLDIIVDYDQEKLFVECSLTVMNPGDRPISEVPLLLYRLLDVKSIVDSEGKAISFTQDIVKFSDLEMWQVNHIRIKLTPSLKPSDKRSFVIRYEGHLMGYTEVMGYVKDHISEDYTVLRTDCYAFPRIGVPSWETNRAMGLHDFEYKASVTVPSSLVVANGGELLGKTESNGEVTYTYRSLEPSWRIDLPIADYKILEDKKNKFKIFYFPTDEEGARKLLASLSRCMELYTQWFGPLQVFSGLAVIEIPNAYGSQTDVTTILQQSSAFDKNTDSHYGFYHELSHLWNVKSSDKSPPRFESEGLAMFLQHLAQEKLEGKPEAKETAVRNMRNRLRKSFADNPEWKDVPMINFGKNNMTGLSYRTGQIFFYILYELLGEELFLETMGSFYQEYYETWANAQDFADHVKKHSPLNLDLFFKEWVFEAKASELIISDIPFADIIDRYRH